MQNGIGYFRHSQDSLLWSELVSSGADLLKFGNDRAYEQAFTTAHSIHYGSLEHLLAFLDTAEILLEVGSYLAGGGTARWVAITVIQLLK